MWCKGKAGLVLAVGVSRKNVRSHSGLSAQDPACPTLVALTLPCFALVASAECPFWILYTCSSFFTCHSLPLPLLNISVSLPFRSPLKYQLLRWSSLTILVKGANSHSKSSCCSIFSPPKLILFVSLHVNWCLPELRWKLQKHRGFVFLVNCYILNIEHNVCVSVNIGRINEGINESIRYILNITFVIVWRIDWVIRMLKKAPDCLWLRIQCLCCPG